MFAWLCVKMALRAKNCMPLVSFPSTISFLASLGKDILFFADQQTDFFLLFIRLLPLAAGIEFFLLFLCIFCILRDVHDSSTTSVVILSDICLLQLLPEFQKSAETHSRLVHLLSHRANAIANLFLFFAVKMLLHPHEKGRRLRNKLRIYR